jgi:hypothetical protein
MEATPEREILDFKKLFSWGDERIQEIIKKRYWLLALIL